MTSPWLSWSSVFLASLEVVSDEQAHHAGENQILLCAAAGVFQPLAEQAISQRRNPNPGR
jgi:hypothetical protein